MVSISFGSILSKGFPVEKTPSPLTVEVANGNPSITYKGSLPAEIDPVPLPVPGILFQVHRLFALQ